jgi:RNA polymerase sigma factor (sigma-70 family)
MTTPALETTHQLVDRIREGDHAARERLIRRYLPLLTRWAHGRLPGSARDLNETADLVQMTLLRAFQSLPAFEVQGPGAFFGYLRQIMSNLLKDELRRVARRPAHDEISHEIVETEPQPLESALNLATLAAYEQALTQLEPEQREAVMLRVELGLSHEEIARVIEAPSANAARMKVARALMRLAELMNAYRS